MKREVSLSFFFLKHTHPSKHTSSLAADQFQAIRVLLLRHQAAASAERKMFAM